MIWLGIFGLLYFGAAYVPAVMAGWWLTETIGADLTHEVIASSRMRWFLRDIGLEALHATPGAGLLLRHGVPPPVAIATFAPLAGVAQAFALLHSARSTLWAQRGYPERNGGLVVAFELPYEGLIERFWPALKDVLCEIPDPRQEGM